MRVRLELLLVSSVLLASSAYGQQLPVERTTAERFLAEHGEGWRVAHEPVTGSPTFVYGSRLVLPGPPPAIQRYQAIRIEPGRRSGNPSHPGLHEPLRAEA